VKKTASVDPLQKNGFDRAVLCPVNRKGRTRLCWVDLVTLLALMIGILLLAKRFLGH